MTLRRAARAGAAAALVTSSVVGAGTPASATNFSGASFQGGGAWASQCAGVNMSDSGTWTVAGVNLTTNVSNAALDSLYNQFDPTHLTVDPVVPDSNTDAVMYDEYYTSACGQNWTVVIGVTACQSLSTTGSGKCNQHLIRWDIADFDAAGADGYRMRSYTCHELGHAVGLTHRSEAYTDPSTTGCMRDDAVFKNNLSPHDVAHINANY